MVIVILSLLFDYVFFLLLIKWKNELFTVQQHWNYLEKKRKLGRLLYLNSYMNKRQGNNIILDLFCISYHVTKKDNRGDIRCSGRISISLSTCSNRHDVP